MTKEKEQGVKQPTKHDKETARRFLPTPWTYSETGFIMSILDCEGSEVLEDSDPHFYKQALLKIVEAVNAYDNLKATNEKLVEALREMHEAYTYFITDIEKRLDLCMKMEIKRDEHGTFYPWGNCVVHGLANADEKAKQLLNEIEKGNNNEQQ